MHKALAIVSGLITLAFASPAHASLEEEKSHAPHPAIVAFFAELDAGDLDRAAARLSQVGDFEWMGVPPLEHDFSQQEFVKFLAQCDLAAEDYKPEFAIRYHKTEWDCPDGERYLVDFLPEDELKIARGTTGPYLQVALFETPKAQADRIAAEKARREAFRDALLAKHDGQFSPLPPPISIRKLSEEEQQARAQQRRAAYDHRDLIGTSVAKSDLDVFVAFATEETAFRYVAHDPYFDVDIEHNRGKGLTLLQDAFRQAISELGKPISSDCYRKPGTYPTHICRWELPNSKNGLFAEMSFNSKDGTLSFIRIYRELPSERQAMRERAIEAGVING